MYPIQYFHIHKNGEWDSQLKTANGLSFSGWRGISTSIISVRTCLTPRLSHKTLPVNCGWPALNTPTQGFEFSIEEVGLCTLSLSFGLIFFNNFPKFYEIRTYYSRTVSHFFHFDELTIQLSNGKKKYYNWITHYNKFYSNCHQQMVLQRMNF